MVTSIIPGEVVHSLKNVFIFFSYLTCLFLIEILDNFFSMAFLMNLVNLSVHMFWTFL